MTMPAEGKQNIRFQLWVNGQIKATAGLDSFGVLSQTLTWVRRDPDKAPSDETDITSWVCNKIHVPPGRDGFDERRAPRLAPG